MTEKKRTAILISGRGSNMKALIEAAKAPDYPASIVGVISNRAEAEGLAYARSQGISIATVTMKAHGGDKKKADAALTAQLLAWEVEIVCLAGFMRILSPGFCRAWSGKLINIHPSLLPAYRGLDTHQRVLDAGDTQHGCTVHFVTPGMDEGPIIGQVIVPVQNADTADSLSARVLNAEHKIYPWALAEVAAGRITIDTAKKNG